MSIPVRYRKFPLVGEPRLHFVVEGTIAEIVNRTPDLPVGFGDHGEVRINDQVVPRGAWHLVRPRAREGISVTLHMPMGGGPQSGVKRAFQLVAMLALIVGTAWIGGGGLAFGAAGSIFGAGQIGAYAAAGAASLLGGLALQAMSPPPSTAALTGSSGRDTTQLSVASLSGNVVQPGATLPRVVGTHKVYPPHLTRPMQEIIDDDMYVEAVLALSGPHDITDIRVGDVPVGQIPDLQVEVRQGLQSDAPLSLVQRQGYVDAPNVDLSSHIMQTEEFTSRLLDSTSPANSLPKWNPVVSRVEPDTIMLDLEWPSGLVSTTDSEAIMAMAVRFRIRLRGATTWRYLPEIHFRNAGVKAFQKSVRLRFGVPDVSPVPAPKFGDQAFAAYYSVPTQDINPIGRGGWTAHGHFYKGSGSGLMAPDNYLVTGVQNVAIYKDRVEFLFPADSVDFPKGQYEIEVMRGFPYNLSVFNLPSYELTIEDPAGSHVLDFFGYRIDGDGFPGLPVIPSKITNELKLSRVTSIWNEHPAPTRHFALIAIRGKGRQYDQISCIASGLVQDWDGTNWENWTTTSNPAPHLRDAHIGRWVGGKQLTSEIINNDDFLEFREWCADNDLTVNAVLDGLSITDAGQLIAGCAFGRVRTSETIGVIIDKDRSADSPHQMFTPMNISNFQYEIVFANRPCGLRARFSDSADNYSEREILVLDPFMPDSGVYEEVRYDGLVTEASVRRRALYDLAQARHRHRTYTCDVDVMEGLTCRRGDLVAIQHDLMHAQAGFARIIGKTLDGSNVTEIRLDATVPTPADYAWKKPDDAWVDKDDAWTGARYGAAIRTTTGAIVIKEVEISADETNVLRFVTPFADTPTIDYDCLVATGPLGEEFKRYYIIDITPTSAETARLTLVDEASELWSEI